MMSRVEVKRAMRTRRTSPTVAHRVERSIALAQDSYLVTHSAPVYVIDSDGIRRVLFTPPFNPEDLAHDVRLLLQ